MDITFYDAIEQQTNEPSSPPMHHRPDGPRKGSGKGWLVAVIVVAVLLAGASAVYWFGVRKKPSAKPSHTQATQEAQLSPAQAAAIKTYKSPTLNLEVAYRADWKLRENPDKTEIILSSPKTTYQRKDGSQAEGVFTVKLRNSVIPDNMESTVHSAVAVKDSEIIAYANPTDQQRQYTNISYGGSDPNHFSFFVVSGSIAYKAGQPFGTSIDLTGQTYLFAGGYGPDTTDSLGFDAVPQASMDTTVFEQAMDIIKNLKVY